MEKKVREGKTYAASPPRWTRRLGEEKERATRSETGVVKSCIVDEDREKDGLTLPNCEPGHWSCEADFEGCEYTICLL